MNQKQTQRTIPLPQHLQASTKRDHLRVQIREIQEDLNSISPKLKLHATLSEKLWELEMELEAL